MSEKKFNFKVLLSYLIYPLYNFTWVPITLIGALHSDKTEWSHTAHTRKINIHELNNNAASNRKQNIG
jgi:hypothetical protein